MDRIVQKLLFFCYWMLCIGGPISSLSALVAAEGSVPVESIAKFRNLTVDQGLSQGSVYAVLQSNDGFVWIATQDGLNKFDGHKFSLYKRDVTDTQLTNNFTTELVQDKNGDIWVGTIYGLNRYSPATNKWQHYYAADSKDSLPSNNIKKLYMDDAGVVWIGTKKGLTYFNAVENKFISLENPFDSSRLVNVDEIAQYSSDVLLLGSNDGVYQFNKKNRDFKFYNISSGGTSLVVNAIQVTDEPDQIVLGTNRGVYYLSLSSGTVSRKAELAFLDNEKIYDLYKDDSGIYLATSFGLHQMSQTSRDARITIKSYFNDVSDPGSISSNHILSIYKDNRGTLWLGTLNGVSLFDSALQQFNHISVKNTVRNTTSKMEVYSLYSDRSNNLWVGTSDGIGVFDSLLKTYQSYAGIEGRVSAFQMDAERNLWIGGSKGLFFLNASNHVVRSVSLDSDGKNFLDGTPVFALLLDDKESLWIGSGWGLFRYYPNSKKVDRYYYDPSNENTISDNQIYSLHDDGQGNLWVGTINGLNRLHKASGKITRYRPDAGNDHQQLFWVFSIRPATAMGFWLATSDGLYFFDPATGQFQRLGAERGLQNDSVFGVLTATDGSVWVSTNNGLARYDTSLGRFNSVSASFGLQNQEFNFGAYTTMPNGCMAFGGVNGINIFDPTKAAGVLLPLSGAPIITQVAILDKNNHRREIHASELSQPGKTNRFQVNWSDTMLSIEFSALNFLYPKDTGYRYKLNGYDSGWVYLSAGLNNAIYTNLNSGAYDFEVQSKIGSGKWSESSRLSFSVAAPPWQSNAAFMGYLLLVFAAIFLFVWRKNRSMKKLQHNISMATEEISRQKNELELVNKDLEAAIYAKEKFYKQLTHELRTPLTLIMAPLELLLAAVADLTCKHWLGLIKNSSTELAGIVDNLLALSSAKQCFHVDSCTTDVNALSKDLLERFSVLAKAKEINLSMESVSGLIYVAAPPADVKVMLNNLLANAIKYTPKGGAVVLKLTADGDIITMRVCDNGFGISELDQLRLFNEFARGSDPRIGEIQGSGLGLVLVKSLAEKAAGSISFKSLLNHGSEFMLTLPARFADAPALDWVAKGDDFVIPEYLGDAFSILVLEDNRDINALVCQVLAGSHQCIPAFSFDEAVVLLNTQTPDLVITDLMLSDRQLSSSEAKGGIELCRLIKTSENLNHIPVIMLTALGQKNHQLYGLSQGADDYISKPFDSREILLRVNNRLAQLSNSRRHFGDRALGLAIPGNENPESTYFSCLADQVRVEFEQHFHDSEYRIDHLAQVMAKSSRTLQMHFKKMGTTFGTLLLDFRLHQARAKIKSGKAVGLVAAECGINDASRFSREYKKKFGLLPSDDKPKINDAAY